MTSIIASAVNKPSNQPLNIYSPVVYCNYYNTLAQNKKGPCGPFLPNIKLKLCYDCDIEPDMVGVPHEAEVKYVSSGGRSV